MTTILERLKSFVAWFIVEGFDKMVMSIIVGALILWSLTMLWVAVELVILYPVILLWSLLIPLLFFVGYWLKKGTNAAHAWAVDYTRWRRDPVTWSNDYLQQQLSQRTKTETDK